MDLHVFRSSKQQKSSFSGWSVCVCQLLAKFKNKSRKFILGTFDLYQMEMLLEAFYEDWVSLGKGAHKRLLIE